MSRNALTLTAAAVALLWLTGQRANAASPYDPYAVDYLTAGFDYATSSYVDNPDDWDAYCAYIYSYYAQYFANVAYAYDDQTCWYYAYVYGSYATSFALDSYYATGELD